MTPGYTAPRDVGGVVAALADGDGLAIGGGTMLVPDLTHGKVRPRVLVDLSRAGLAGVTAADDGVVVGAMTTYADLAAADLPLLPRVARGITGGPQIRHRGTAGGSACYANPASDVPACLVALKARMRLASARGGREVEAGEFFTDGFRTAREPDEVLTAFTVPRTDAAIGYLKFKLAESSWPIVTAAALVGPAVVRVAIGGAAATPVVVEVGRESWADAHREAVWAALDAARPWSDVLADAAYRRRVAPVIADRAVAHAVEEERCD
ncbi:FAD binding domain-containing protein [Actinosynnema sp. NPDC059335]|uniref:FAD binding domain-containing protein n=1 Tax=Actinosynnema sp. NPDC059335 TaxID=3346804 RepID=UPI00366D487D